MKKKFVKLNNNDNHLSLGNLCRYIKNASNNKVFATQTEIFCAIFNVEDANDSTVNNYCIGYRSIGTIYKNIYYDYQKKYKEDKYILIDNVLNILSIIEGKFYSNDNYENTIKFINNNSNLKELIINLYNIAKNDNDVSREFTTILKEEINNNNLYFCLCNILFFTILEKKQPIYVDNIVKNAIENIINNTNISINDLENFLDVEFMDGINYTYKIKNMANENNPYALFNLGMMEYNGDITGNIRYNKCFEYMKKAAISGHPRANFMIAYLIYNEMIGNKSKEDLKLAWYHLNIAKDAGSIAAINTMGLVYLYGYTDDNKKNINKAIFLFEEAANYNYTYAFNNLGKIYEDKKEYKKAYEYYLKSANLEESWACNKIGEFYRKGIGIDKDIEKAFYYYNKGCEAPIKNQCYWNKYNLAKYFYLSGCYEVCIDKDTNKAISLLEDICDNLIEASVLLFYMAISKRDEDKILLYKNKIEMHKDYTRDIKQDIDEELDTFYKSKLNIEKIINN